MSIAAQERINAALNLIPQHLDPIERKIYVTLCAHIGHTDDRLRRVLRITENLALQVKFRGGPDMATKNLSVAFVSEGRQLVFLVVIHIVDPENPKDFRTVEVLRARGERDEDVGVVIDEAAASRNMLKFS
ncbi:hypothetical protein P3342_005283 [Pyrenophora teres f. teres]|uniref:Uncharacterized protein n=2 Tax=Pyrenophora teres f. teres TaxID=97479 RepID=E3SA03_PYRTT|nr:hypothetical protein PTT_19914 [Pyrenophora teres f. teres 0-1]KAE8846184.1 hypothetical protein HRS9139_00751 [Pyrenophora teres f. teres]KAE8848324.1 hypothetical protein PTNB85_02167 [Pyrenophora teres f. teres]KAE8853510.1 hypothetical protein HRS9122_00502 [Pyrenophora teres f. teres]KAE8868249.1 hypothetical protein PTNB29_02160 [Pyrenophora teres f. teres]